MISNRGNYIEDPTTGVSAKVNPHRSLHVASMCFTEEPADFYLYQTVVTPSLTATATIGSRVFTVDSNVGVVNGHAITLYEGERMFQSIVQSSTPITITVASPVDYAYTPEATVETGIWNMAVNGLAVAQEFMIKAPPGRDVHVHTINCSILDVSAMDDGLFGGIAQLTNGLIWRFVDGNTKNLAVIVNNLGFWEIGFDTSYSNKAPAGQYGFKARRDVKDINGVVLFLKGAEGSEFRVMVQDDLTNLDLMAVTINGHFLQPVT